MVAWVLASMARALADERTLAADEQFFAQSMTLASLNRARMK